MFIGAVLRAETETGAGGSIGRAADETTAAGRTVTGRGGRGATEGAGFRISTAGSLDITIGLGAWAETTDGDGTGVA